MRSKLSKEVLDETKERRKTVNDQIQQGELHASAYGRSKKTKREKKEPKKRKSTRDQSNHIRDMVSRKKMEAIMERRIAEERKAIITQFRSSGSIDDPSESSDEDSLLKEPGFGGRRDKTHNDSSDSSADSSTLEVWSDDEKNEKEQVEVKEEGMALFQPESIKIGNYPPIDHHEDMMPLFAPPHFDLDTGCEEISDLQEI